MDKIRKIVLMLVAIIIEVMVIGQDTALRTTEDKNGFMRSEGKIYVVAAITLVILTGLIVYVARLDRKITRLEKGDSN